MTMRNPAAKQVFTGNVGRGGLPAWTYDNDEITELEKEFVFRRNWLLVGHVNAIPNPGDYMTLDVADERAMVVRGGDGEVRTFHNLCRHRGSRVAPERQGNCGKVITCPFHGWCYNLDGGLRAVQKPETFPDLDKSMLGLKPIEQEIWHGFVFIRFKAGGPSVAETMAPVEDEIAPYRIEDMQPYDKEWYFEMDVNWKAQVDVDSEGYHVPIAHPSLEDLFGPTYVDEVFDGDLARSFGTFDDDRNRRLWSVRHYVNLLPEVTHLPESHRRAWIYQALFPTTVIDLTPDTVSFYQFLPIATRRSAMRGGNFIHPDNSREMRAARYLNRRIGRTTGDEDVRLIKWSWEGMRSSAFEDFILSDLENGVRAYHDRLREVMPVFNLNEAPPAGTIAERNFELTSTS
jgi:phenylpropionate dioxygenase-like ring-hydroxylating dioxygenase large terminal subunit